MKIEVILSQKFFYQLLIAFSVENVNLNIQV